MWTYLPPSPIYTRSINCRVLFPGYRFLHESRFFLDWGYKRTRSVHEDRCRVSRHLYSVWYKCTRSVHEVAIFLDVFILFVYNFPRMPHFRAFKMAEEYTKGSRLFCPAAVYGLSRSPYTVFLLPVWLCICLIETF